MLMLSHRVSQMRCMRARYMVFGLEWVPGLIVHLCPTLTRIRGHVQSTWNELINSDHQPRHGQCEQDGGRQRGRRGATRNFQINRPPVINNFWRLVMFALAWLFVASDAATRANIVSTA